MEAIGTQWVGDEFAYPSVPDLPPKAQAWSLDARVAQIQQLRPSLRIHNVHFPDANEGGPLYVDGQDQHWLVRDRANKVYVDPYNGELMLNQKANELSVFKRWIDTADPLHFGDFAGLLSKAIWFVFGLILSALCLTGTYLHAQRVQRELLSRRGVQRTVWPGTRVAVVVSMGVLFVAVLGGVAEIRDYGPLNNGIQAWPIIPGAVVVFLVVWLAITLALLLLWLRLALIGSWRH